MTASALILDFGEVLVRPQPAASIAAMAALAGIGPDEFTRRYWQHRPAYDRGDLDGTRYWEAVLSPTPLGTAERTAVVGALKDADYRSWTHYRDDLWTLTAGFRARGGRTAILSNGVPEIMGRVAHDRDLSHWFDAVVVSYEVGCIKPDPRIYQICLERLDVAAPLALFVDDRVENLDAARRLGMRTFHFTGDASVAALSALLK